MTSADRPAALAAADFDGDGMPDLAVGYGTEGGGAIVLHRGNVDAVFPHSPAAQRRRADGSFRGGAFLPTPRRLDLPSAVDFLGAGDFDNDGRQDLLAGTRGGRSLQVLRGDGRGGLSRSADLDLGGWVSAVLVGDLNRVDGVPDVVAAVSRASGPALVVLENPAGVLAAKPESVELPAPSTLLTLGRVRGTSFVDIIATAGGEMFVVAGRDRRLLVGGPDAARVAPPSVDRLLLPAPVGSLAWGDFLAEPTAREEFAVVTRDGRLLFLDLEERDGTVGFAPLEANQRCAAGAAAIPARLSGLPTQDLLILDPAGWRLVPVAGLRRPEPAAPGAGNALVEMAGGRRWSYPDAEGRPLAVLPMRLNGDARPDLVVLQEGLPAPTLALSAPESVITVNVAWAGTAAGDSSCTLHEAINNANANADTTLGDCAAGAGLDTIAFAIGGGGSVATIGMAGLTLPIITDSVTIDGTTQGCADPPCIELNGTATGGTAIRLNGAAGGNTVRGLVINRFGAHGIFGSTSGNIIEGNRIGTDWTGMADQGNGGAGIWMTSAGAAFNTIGGTVAAARNLISGNTGRAIVLASGAHDNEVAGNHVGIDAAGSGAIPNAYTYVVHLEAAVGNTIGGAAAGAGNVISGNAGNGIVLNTGSTGNLIQGNHIGVNPAGASAIANGSSGIWLYGSPSNVIGGTAPGARNIVSGNGSDGILIGNLSDDNDVLGNYVGVDATGTAAIPNVLVGVELDHSSLCTIGGAVPGARNVISGNTQNGILLDTGSTGNSVLGNHIGVNAAGTAALGNTLSGIILIGASSNLIGGSEPAARNVVSGNGGDGVFLYNLSVANQVLGNYLGVDATGTLAIPNLLEGVEIQNSTDNTVGGTAPGAGNVISGNGEVGVFLDVDAGGNALLGNHIGVGPDGTTAIPNQFHGVQVNAAWNTIGGPTPSARNVISGNLLNGVFLSGAAATGNTVQGNYIGLDATGTLAVGNGWNGVELQSAPANTIGGDAPGTGNVIAASILYNGVMLNASDGTRVQGNLIGTDAGGTVALGNGNRGVRVYSSQLCTIGGTAAAARNVISGNRAAGIELDTSTGNVVQGNLIGTDVTGTVALGNAGSGVALLDAGASVVGGTEPGAGNVVAANAFTGVSINSSNGVIVRGNSIGTDATGTLALGNGYMGVRVRDSVGAQIGGAAAGEGNRIVYNGESGVIVHGTSAGSLILGNAIAGNGLLGIELGEADGVTANDAGDGDTGPNDLQNFPVLTWAVASPGGVVAVEGSLESAPGETFRLEFFATEACDATGHGEGRRPLGSEYVVTDGTGYAPFSVLLAANLQAGEMVTATATSASNSTSEFSACAAASCSDLAVFPHAVLALDNDHLVWGTAADVRWAKGSLAFVGSYSTLADGTLYGATGLDLSADQPPSRAGLYYLVRPLFCGSWQSSFGDQPGRDVSLPGTDQTP